MMSFVDPSTALLAACGGDTVKLFYVSVGPGDPCTLSYTPSPGSQVNSVKWNHTNLVAASAGDDKISLWWKNGQSLGIVPVSGSEIGDSIDNHIMMDDLCDHVWEFRFEKAALEYWQNLDRLGRAHVLLCIVASIRMAPKVQILVTRCGVVMSASI